MKYNARCKMNYDLLAGDLMYVAADYAPDDLVRVFGTYKEISLVDTKTAAVVLHTDANNIYDIERAAHQGWTEVDDFIIAETA